jgi:hypothetical protein
VIRFVCSQSTLQRQLRRQIKKKHYLYLVRRKGYVMTIFEKLVICTFEISLWKDSVAYRKVILTFLKLFSLLKTTFLLQRFISDAVLLMKMVLGNIYNNRYITSFLFSIQKRKWKIVFSDTFFLPSPK